VNSMTVTFTNDDGNGGPADGPITIDSMDWYHLTDAGLAGSFILTGQNDTTIGGATGTMVGGVMTFWSAPLTGEIHNELTCTDIVPATFCGTLGLPASGDTSIVHQSPTAAVNGSIAIDTAGVPVAAAQPMTFDNAFQTVSMQMDLPSVFLRQYYQIHGATASYVPPVPASGTVAQVVMLALLALVGVFAMSQGRFSPLAMRGR
jgi:hypothetical protein